MPRRLALQTSDSCLIEATTVDLKARQGLMLVQSGPGGCPDLDHALHDEIETTEVDQESGGNAAPRHTMIGTSVGVWRALDDQSMTGTNGYSNSFGFGVLVESTIKVAWMFRLNTGVWYLNLERKIIPFI